MRQWVPTSMVEGHPELSWKAKGLWVYLLTRSKETKLGMEDLRQHTRNGRDSIRSGIKELEQANILYRETVLNSGGLSRIVWHVFPEPQDPIIFRNPSSKPIVDYCRYCGIELKHHEIQMDHVFPKSRGGLNTEDNLVPSCRECNVKKGARTPEEAGMDFFIKRLT